MVTVETIEELIASSRPRRKFLRGSTFVLIGLGMLLGALIADPGLFFPKGSAAWLLPQLVLIVLVITAVRTTRRRRRLANLMIEGFEAVQLRQWDKARQALVRLLRNPMERQETRTESLLALAAIAEAGHNYDASQRVYESLQAEKVADPLHEHVTRVALAAAMLRTGQITDAVKLIDRLCRADLPAALKAQVELLALFREVTMGQAGDSLEQADQRRELFRDYLGTKAGYGYGLLAFAFDRVNQQETARHYWHDATMLVRPAELVERFDELAAVAQKYPAAEYVL